MAAATASTLLRLGLGGFPLGLGDGLTADLAIGPEARTAPSQVRCAGGQLATFDRLSSLFSEDRLVGHGVAFCWCKARNRPDV